MGSFNELSDMEQNRINELRFRALIDKMLKATNYNLCEVLKYIEHISKFFNYNTQEIVEITKEIITDRYKPSIDEIIKINLLLGITISEIAEMLDMNISTVKTHIYRSDNNVNNIILYPRLKVEQLQEIKKFLKLFYAFYIPTNKVYIS